MARCGRCNKDAITVSARLGFCADCIREYYDKVSNRIGKVRARLRKSFNLPESIPSAKEGVECHLCANRCRIEETKTGFCGVWRNTDGKLRSAFGMKRVSAVSFYYDALPTNCVADWVCPAHTGAGFPKFAHSKGTEYGYKNLAVFYQSCNFDCFFCQNWHFRDSGTHTYKTPEEVSSAVDDETACICYFGGDPTPNAKHSLDVARIARGRNPERILRICWETNGAVSVGVLRKMAQLALESGGCIKFDLKFGSDELSKAICGVSNRAVFENFRYVARLAKKRPEVPLLVASTLLIPGYVDEKELDTLASFIASVDKGTPWALLGFHPDYYLTDLPRTSRSHAETALHIARKYGIENVRIGNLHLLSNAY